MTDRVRSNQSYIGGVDPPPQGGGVTFFWKYFDKHIRSQYFCYHSKEKVWADVLNTHNTTIWLTKNFLRRFEKKVCKFLKSKYASSLSQFYMALVVFCMKIFSLNVSKKLSIHFSSTFYIFKTFSGTRAIQRTLNRVFAMRQTQANVDKSVKNVKFGSLVAYLIAYGAIWPLRSFWCSNYSQKYYTDIIQLLYFWNYEKNSKIRQNRQNKWEYFRGHFLIRWNNVTTVKWKYVLKKQDDWSQR